MTSVTRKTHKVKTPILLTIILGLLALLFPGQQITVTTRPRRRKFDQVAYLAALDSSLRFGYAAVRWEVL